MDCSEYFEEGKSGYVFGTKITDNNTNFGENMGMCNTSVGKLNNSDGIDTIEASKKRFTTRDQKQASRVRRYQHVGGHPSEATLKYSSVTNGVKNSPFTKQDIEMTTDMLGQSDVAVQGKTTRTQPDAVVAQDNLVELPPSIIQYYGKVELAVDVMHVNRIPFLTSLSRKIHYGTVNALADMKIPTMEVCIEKIIRAYSVRGFHVTVIHVDIQFKAIKDRKILKPLINVVF